MTGLADKVALVTGASQGMGRGIALSLATAGADVVINYRSDPEGARSVAEVVGRLGRTGLPWQADVADRAAVAAMIDGTVERFGHLDIAVANAGINIREPVIEARWENVLRTIQVTQFGVFHTCQMAAQQMVRQSQTGRPGGKILVISSVQSEIPVPGSAAYNMAKAAINHLGRTMAVELAPYQINVNIIHPGWTDTPNTRAVVSDEDIRKGSERVPWKRLGRPEEIGQAVVYLASQDADYVTGASLRVDGGFVIGLRLPLDD